MSTTYDDLRKKFHTHIDKENDEENKAADIVWRVIECCRKNHGVPVEAIKCHPPSDEVQESGGQFDPRSGLRKMPSGMWTLDLVLQIGDRNLHQSWVIAAVRPEIRFSDNNIELSFKGDSRKFPFGGKPEDQERMIGEYAETAMQNFAKTIQLLDEPENGPRRAIGFHAASQTASAIPKHPSPLP
jgi:hypothetical protein